MVNEKQEKQLMNSKITNDNDDVVDETKVEMNKNKSTTSAIIKVDPCLSNKHASTKRTLLLLGLYKNVPKGIQRFHEKLNGNLKRYFNELSLLNHVYLYDPSQLHITIATLHRQNATKPNNIMIDIVNYWIHAISKQQENFKTTTVVQLQQQGAVFDGDGVGVLLWNEKAINNHKIIDNWRSCLRLINNNNSDKSMLFIPNIVHSTVMRWKKEPPSHINVQKIRSVFQQAVDDTWQQIHADGLHNHTMRATLTELRLVEETKTCLQSCIEHHLFDLGAQE